MGCVGWSALHADGDGVQLLDRAAELQPDNPELWVVSVADVCRVLSTRC